MEHRRFGCPLGILRAAEGGKSSVNHERLAPSYFHWKCGFAVWNIEHASQCRCCKAWPAKTVDYASRCLLVCLGCRYFHHFDAQVRLTLGLRFGRNGRRLLAEIKVAHYHKGEFAPREARARPKKVQFRDVRRLSIRKQGGCKKQKNFTNSCNFAIMAFI